MNELSQEALFELSSARIARFMPRHLLPSPRPLGFILGTLHFATFVLGTLGTVYFMSTFRSAIPGSEPAA